MLLSAKKHTGLYFANVEEVKGSNVAPSFNPLSADTVETVQTCENNDEKQEESDSKLWNERLDHVSKTTIAKMKKTNSVTGLESSKHTPNSKRIDRKIISCRASLEESGQCTL